MSTPFVDPDDGPVSEPPNAAYDGTQVTQGGLEVRQGARIVLDPTLYVLADTYTLVDYQGASLMLVPSADLTTQNLLNYLTIDDSRLQPNNLRVTGVELNTAESKIFITLGSL